MKYSAAVRNAKLNALRTEAGDRATLVIFAGTAPAAAANTATGTVLAEILLPAEWMKPAVNGQADMSGEWRVDRASASGVPTYFRIYDQAGICHLQGDVGTEMLLAGEDGKIAAGQPVIVKRFSIRDNNG